MSLVTGIIAYILIWWLVLFTMLPVGVERDPDPQTGNMTGAPKHHNLKKKMMATSVISAFILLVVYVLIRIEIVDFYDLARNMSMQDDLRE